jgi:hypothetical protein
MIATTEQAGPPQFLNALAIVTAPWPASAGPFFVRGINQKPFSIGTHMKN